MPRAGGPFRYGLAPDIEAGPFIQRNTDCAGAARNAYSWPYKLMKIGCLPDASTYDAETCRAKARSIGPRLAGSRRLVPLGHCSETALLVRCFERVWRVASVPAVFSGEAHGE